WDLGASCCVLLSTSAQSNAKPRQPRCQDFHHGAQQLRGEANLNPFERAAVGGGKADRTFPRAHLVYDFEDDHVEPRLELLARDHILIGDERPASQALMDESAVEVDLRLVVAAHSQQHAGLVSLAVKI